jgi:23S rRNA maturation mini-RNase III
MFGGMALMAVNFMAGGLLAVAGPAIFAMFARGRVQDEVRKRAKELAPEVMRETAAKVGPKLEELIDGFVAKLDAWVVGAGQELQREVVEVLVSTRQAKGEAAHDAAKAAAEVEAQAAALSKVAARLGELRDAL